MEEEKITLTDAMAEELGSELDAITEMEIGSEQQTKAVENLATLAKIRQDLIKADADHNLDEEKFNFEKEKFEYEKQQDIKREKAEKRDKLIGYVISIAGIAVPALLGIARIRRDDKWMVMGFEYEKEGAITSKTFNSLLKHFNSPRE